MKKQLLTALITLFFYTGYSQSTNDSLFKYISITKDKITGEIEVKSKNIIEGKSKDAYDYILTVSYNNTNKAGAISYACPELKCVDEGNEVNYLFVNDSKFLNTHTIGFNCDGFIITYYKSLVSFSPKLLSKFIENKVSMIRLNSMKRSTDIELTPDQSILFSNQVKWLKYYLDNKKAIDKLIL